MSSVRVVFIGPESVGVLTWGPLVLHPLDQLAVVAGVETRLTPRQTRILARLVRARGRIVSNEDLWRDFDVPGKPILANIRFHMCALRGRLDPDRTLIETWAGKGYALRAAPPPIRGSRTAR